MSDPSMPNPTAAAQGQPGQPQQQQIQVPINDAEMDNIYCNWFRVSGNWDEVLVDATHIKFSTGTEDYSSVNLFGKLKVKILSHKTREQ